MDINECKSCTYYSGCDDDSKRIIKSQDARRKENFKKFLKELSALCDKYRVVEISSDNGQVLFVSNNEIACLSSLQLCKTRGENDTEWCAMGVSIASAPVYICLDEEDE